MTEQKNAVAPLKQFNQFIANPRTQDYLGTVLAEKKSSFVNNITALVSNNASLQVCKPDTVMFACLKATALDLPLDQNLGFAYVIAYKDNRAGVTNAQFQLGYKGFIQLALRSGQFKTINVTDVREGELVDEDFITGEYTFQRAADRTKLPVVGYCAYFKLLNGFEKYHYMTVEECEAHAKRYSKTYASQYENTRSQSKWTTDFDAMAEKTVLKLLLSKYAPLSVEMRDAIKADQAVITGDDSYEYVDNEPEEQTQQEDVEERKETLRARAGKGEKAPEMP